MIQTVSMLATLEQEKMDLKKSSDRLLRKVNILKADSDR